MYHFSYVLFFIFSPVFVILDTLVHTGRITNPMSSKRSFPYVACLPCALVMFMCNLGTCQPLSTVTSRRCHQGLPFTKCLFLLAAAKGLALITLRQCGTPSIWLMLQGPWDWQSDKSQCIDTNHSRPHQDEDEQICVCCTAQWLLSAEPSQTSLVKFGYGSKACECQGVYVCVSSVRWITFS